MITFKERRAIIRKLKKADNCILVCLNKEDFDFGIAGDSRMNAGLFEHLKYEVRRWCRLWPHNKPDQEDEAD